MKAPSRALSPTRTPRKKAQFGCCSIGTAPALALSLCCAFLILLFSRLGTNVEDKAAFVGERNAGKLAELPLKIRGVGKSYSGSETRAKLGNVNGLTDEARMEEGETLLRREGRAPRVRVSKPGTRTSGLSEVVLLDGLQAEDSELVDVKKSEQPLEGQLADGKTLGDPSSAGVIDGFVKSSEGREQEKESLQEDEGQKPALDGMGLGQSLRDENMGLEGDGQANQLQDPSWSNQESGVTARFSETDPLPEALYDTELIHNEEGARTINAQVNPVQNQILVGREHTEEKKGLAANQANELELEDEVDLESGLSSPEVGQESLVKNRIIVAHQVDGHEGTHVGSTEVPLTSQAESVGEYPDRWQNENEEQRLQGRGQLVGDLKSSFLGVSVTDQGVNELGSDVRQTAAESEKVNVTLDSAGASSGHVAEDKRFSARKKTIDDELFLAVLPELSGFTPPTETGKGVEAKTSLMGESYSLADADKTGQSGKRHFQQELTKAFEEGSECMLEGTQLFDGNASLLAGARAYGRCAFVGNSGVLRAAEHGDEIDGHDVVMRSNQAPTRSYEEFVGSKTSFRFLNKKWAVVYASANQGRGILLPREDPGTVLIASRSEGPEFARLVTAVRETRPDVTAVHLSGDVRRCAHVALQSARKPSTGFLAIFFLLQACESVDVYGLSMDRSTGDVAQSWPYHYFEHYVDSENLRAHPHHSFEMEGDLIRALGSELPARIRVADHSHAKHLGSRV